ncbi:MAG: hypothetical protein GY910_06740 [bacterium]|nr:hypothetical protein [bacterium]
MARAAGDRTDLRAVSRNSNALGLDESFLSLDVLDDGKRLHAIDVRPHLGLAVDRGLAFSGMDTGALALDIAIGEHEIADLEAAESRRGFALRFFYPTAQGCLEFAPVPSLPKGSSRVELTGWQSIPRSESRTQVDWEKDAGQAVERPRSTADRIACVFAESKDRNTAWMCANEIDPEPLFCVLESNTEITTSQPICQ